MELTMDQALTTIPAIVVQRAASNPDDTILRAKDRGIWKSISWSSLDARVREIGLALLAAGFARGDVAGIISETRPEAAFADLAILGCGAACVAIDPDADAEQVAHLLSCSGARLVFAENEEQLDKILSIRDRCPGLSRIVVFDMKGLRDFADAAVGSLPDFIATGGTGDWAAAVGAITPDQPAVIHFPPGLGAALGQTLTHADLAALVTAAGQQLPIRPNDERLAVLRLADIAERIWGLYLALASRCISNYPEGPDTVIENLRELQPTVLVADASVWGHLHALATARAKAATRTQRWAYDWALNAGRLGGSGARLADLLVLRAIRREFGLNRLRLAYAGGDPIGPAAVDWARSLGIGIQRVDQSGAEATRPASQMTMRNAHA